MPVYLLWEWLLGPRSPLTRFGVSVQCSDHAARDIVSMAHSSPTTNPTTIYKEVWLCAAPASVTMTLPCASARQIRRTGASHHRRGPCQGQNRCSMDGHSGFTASPIKLHGARPVRWGRSSMTMCWGPMGGAMRRSLSTGAHATWMVSGVRIASLTSSTSA